MERFIWDLIVLSVRTIIWLFMVSVRTGPWIMNKTFQYILHPLLGTERMLRMGKGSTIPISMVCLGALWGGIWLLAWGALGSGDLAWWGVVFGVIAGWRAGSHVADGFEQVRIAKLLDVHEQPPTDSVPEKRIDNRPGQVNIGGFNQSLPPEDEPQPVGGG